MLLSSKMRPKIDLIYSEEDEIRFYHCFGAKVVQRSNSNFYKLFQFMVTTQRVKIDDYTCLYEK